MNEEEIKVIENQLAYTLAKVYMNIPWRKVGVSNAHKFFIDRIRASTNTKTFKEFIDILTKKCNVEIVKIDTEIIENLDQNNQVTMRILRTESLYICNLALETVDTIKKEGE